MIERRPFEKLGGARYDWLNTKHHFWKRCVSNSSILKSPRRPILSTSMSEIAPLEAIA